LRDLKCFDSGGIIGKPCAYVNILCGKGLFSSEQHLLNIKVVRNYLSSAAKKRNCQRKELVIFGWEDLE
jgi:hypothetical protein